METTNYSDDVTTNFLYPMICHAKNSKSTFVLNVYLCASWLPLEAKVTPERPPSLAGQRPLLREATLT